VLTTSLVLQVIDDTKNITLVGVGSVCEAVRKELESDKESATKSKARRADAAGRRAARSCFRAPAAHPLARVTACFQKAAEVVGRMIAEKCKEKGIEAVVFDRGGFKYHGRIEALADAARGAGLVF